MTTHNTEQFLTDDEGLFLTEDGENIFFGINFSPQNESLHFIRHEIHSCQNIDQLNSINFIETIIGFTGDYPTGSSQNYHMYIHAMQEYNRKLSNFGFKEDILQPIDAGFRPLDFSVFFPTPDLSDYLLLQEGSFLLQENSFKLILEQDIA